MSENMNSNANITNAVTDFYFKLDNYVNTIKSKQYMFNVSKCCGYSEFVSVYKSKSTLADLYKQVTNQFEYNDYPPVQEIRLFVKKDDSYLEIPNESNISLRNFINVNAGFFTPIYPLPASIVYTMYLEDGHIHDMGPAALVPST